MGSTYVPRSMQNTTFFAIALSATIATLSVAAAKNVVFECRTDFSIHEWGIRDGYCTVCGSYFLNQVSWRLAYCWMDLRDWAYMVG